MKIQTILTAVSVAVMSLALQACSDGTPKEASKADAAETSTGAVVHKGDRLLVLEKSPLSKALVIDQAMTKSIEQPISVPGAIEADLGRLVKITPPLAGRVVKLHKMLGDSVQVGDALFTLDSADMSVAHGDATKADATLQQARRDLARQKTLYDADIAPAKDYEAAQLALASAEIDAQAKAARLAQLGATSANASQRTYVLRSPIAGRVIDMTGSQGGYWNDITQPLMTVADLSTVWLSASVSEKDIAAAFVGQSARIELNAYPGQIVNGKVKYVSPVLDQDTRTVKVRVAVDNPDGRMRPGMFARVIFSGQQHAAVMVPAAALLQSGLYTRVFVEKGPLEFEPRIVKTGVSMGDMVEVVEGLKAGERIVVKNGVLLND